MGRLRGTTIKGELLMSKKGITEGMKIVLHPFEEEMKKMKRDRVIEKQDLDSFLDDIIDVIELNNKCKDDKEIKEMLKNKRLKKAEPKRYTVSVIYENDNDIGFAESIRQDLNNKKNACGVKNHKSFRNDPGAPVDFRLFINCDKPGNGTEADVIYKAYGMCVFLKKDGYGIIFNPDHNFSDSEKAEFIKYYEKVLSKALYQSEQAKKALLKRKKHLNTHTEGYETKFSSGILSKMEETFYNSLDFFDNKGIIGELISIPVALIEFVIFTVSTLLFVAPLGVTEILINATVDNLKEKSFESKFVADAQKQILQVKISELFANLQMEDILC